MKRLAVLNWNSIIPDLSDHFEIVSPYDIRSSDGILLWNEVVTDCYDLKTTAATAGIPVFVLQHGWMDGKATEYKQWNQRSDAEIFFSWTETSKSYYVRDGLEPERVKVVGCPLFEYWQEPKPDGKLVVFQPPHLGLTREENDKNFEISKRAWNEITGIPDIDPIVKLLVYDHAQDMFEGGRKAITNRNSDYHVKFIFDLLKNASCVVSQYEGTFSFLAYTMDIPVITIRDAGPSITNAHSASTIIELSEAIKYSIAHPEAKREERAKAVADHLGDPSIDTKTEIAEAIKVKLGE